MIQCDSPSDSKRFNPEAGTRALLSRLVRRVPRRSRCDAGFHHGLPWKRWAFNALHVVVAATGTAYLHMKLVLTTDDPFALVNHPWQPAMLSTHVITAPFFVACFGMLFRSHTLRKLISPSRFNRRTGWASLLGFAAMTASDYLIQIASTPAMVDFFIWFHVVSSLLFVIGYSTHLVIGRRVDEAEPIVRIRDDDQIRVLPAADGSQLDGIPFTNPLLPRSAPRRKRKRPDVPAVEVPSPQEPAHERIGLRVLAEQGDADAAHGVSQPRATVSDRAKPSIVRSGLSLTRAGPLPSRENQRPFAPAR